MELSFIREGKQITNVSSGKNYGSIEIDYSQGRIRTYDSEGNLDKPKTIIK
jgi:hypothetical protein